MRRTYHIIFYHLRMLKVFAQFRALFLRALGAQVGNGTKLPWTTEMDWPHRVRIGSNCILKSYLSFHFDGPWGKGDAIVVGDRVFLGRGVEFNISESITIGDDTLVGSGTKFIDHDHVTAVGKLIRIQPCVSAPIVVGQDCWIGSSCTILKGIRIGDSSIIGAGSVVNTDIPSMEIWAGAPARKIGTRS